MEVIPVNLLKVAMQKVGLVLCVLGLWILDDFIPILPDMAVWAIVGGGLKIAGHSDRLDGLKWFWTGEQPSTK